MTNRLLSLSVLLVAFAGAAGAQDAPRVALDTSMGRIVLELAPDRAPATVANFLQYTQDGFYDGTVFHRVIDGFMIQGGGFGEDMKKKPTRDPVMNEADKGLRNERGTIAMARTQDPHSATAQFFINLVNNDFLDHKAKDTRGWGYTAFGRVVEGMAVVDQIKTVPTGNQGSFQNVPREPVIIRSAKILGE